jgi:hypothetical protein
MVEGFAPPGGSKHQQFMSGVRSRTPPLLCGLENVVLNARIATRSLRVGRERLQDIRNNRIRASATNSLGYQRV